jgi:hypothetical protein
VKKITLLIAVLLVSACQSTQIKTQEETDQEIALKKEIEILKNGGMCSNSYYFASKDVVFSSSKLKKSIGDYGDFVDLIIDENKIITAYYNYESMLKFDPKKHHGAASKDLKFMIQHNSVDFGVFKLSNPDSYELKYGCLSGEHMNREYVDMFRKLNLIK